MRGENGRQRAILVIFDAEQRVPKGHPLRRIKALADAVLAQLSPRLDEMYSGLGRPSIPPDRLLKASLLMALYTVRSERMFCEQLGYNFLFRWFLNLETDEASFDHSTFSRNRVRLLEHAVADDFFRAVAAHALQLLSDEHFTIDRTLIEAWASPNNFKRENAGPHEPPEDPANLAVDFYNERHASATDQSTAELEAKLVKKGADTCFLDNSSFLSEAPQIDFPCKTRPYRISDTERRRRSECMTRLQADPEFKASSAAAASVGLKRKWRDDPQFAAKVATAASEVMKRLHADPDLAAKSAAKIAMALTTPEFKAAASERAKRQWADPVQAAKKRAAISAGRKRQITAQKRLKQSNPS